MLAWLLMWPAGAGFAQQTLPDYDRARQFVPQNIEQQPFSYTIKPNYINNGTDFWYEFKTSDGTNWYLVEPARKSKQPLFDVDEMAAQLTVLTGDPYDGKHLPLKGLRLSERGDSVLFEVKTDQFVYNRKLNQLSKEAPGKKNGARDWGNVAPDKSLVIYGKNYDLYCVSLPDYEKLKANPNDSTVQETRLTTTGQKDFSFAMQERNVISDGGPQKTDSTKRTRAMGYWSPDSKYFVQTVTDQRPIKDLWVINSIAEPRPTLETYKYQLPGEPGATTHLYVFEPATKQQKLIKTEAFKDQTLSVVSGKSGRRDWSQMASENTWQGDKNRFYLSRMSRDMKRYDLCSYTFGDDSIVPVIQERLNTYIDTRPVAVTSDGNDLILWSERDGWAHLYRYDKNGNMKNRITKGAWHVDQIAAVDEAGKVIYFMANGKEADDTTPYYEHMYRVNFDGSGLQLLTPGDYFHLCHIDNKKQYIVDNYSRVNTVPEICLYDTNGKKVMHLETADMSSLFKLGYQFPEPFQAKAADGITDLYGIIYKPFDFDSTKVYPVINYVYPGPQQEGTYFRYIQMNPRTDRLAQAGFIVVACGHRGGHPSRSKWYHNYGYNNLRDYPMADHKTVIEQLCTQRPYMDVNKVGIHGHSGGGFMSTAAVLLYPDFFKVAVSCAGNHDNNIYNRGWSERHHGVTEKTNDQGETIFDIKVPVNQELAANLKGHLLLIHGDVDNNVHPANSTRVVNELIKAGKRFDMLYIPGKQHHFDDYNEYFYWKMVDYFSEHLKGESEKSIDIKGLQLGNWFQGYQD